MSINAELQELKSIGHGFVGVVNIAILLAIVGVILSARSQTVNVLQSFFALLAWLVGLVVQPLQTGVGLPFSSTLETAGQLTGQAVPTGTGGASGTATAPLPPGWSTTYQPGWTAGSFTTSTGQYVSGYYPPSLGEGGEIGRAHV